MSNFGPSSAFLFVGGKNLSGVTYVLDESIENIFEQTHGLGDSWEEQLPVGLSRAMLEANGGVYDDAADSNNAAFVGQGATEQAVCWGMNGISYGAECGLAQGDYAATYKRIAARDGLTKAHALHVVTGRLYRGRIVHPLVAETADPGNSEGANNIDELTSIHRASIPITSSNVSDQITCPVPHGLKTGNVIEVTGHSGSTPSINGAQTVASVQSDTVFTITTNITVGGTGGSFKQVNTTDGGTCQLHVTALTLGGYTNITIKVRHSTDDTTYADLATFTAVTSAPFANTQVVTGTIHRYLAVSWDYTGAGSGQTCTFLVAVGRNS